VIALKLERTLNPDAEGPLPPGGVGSGRRLNLIEVVSLNPIDERQHVLHNGRLSDALEPNSKNSISQSSSRPDMRGSPWDKSRDGGICAG